MQALTPHAYAQVARARSGLGLSRVSPDRHTTRRAAGGTSERTCLTVRTSNG